MEKYLEKPAIKDAWGDEFVKLADDPRIHFTMEAIFVDLFNPVQVVGNDKTETVKTIRIEEPTVSVLKTSDTAKGEMAKAAILLGSAVGIPDAVVSSMKSRDFMRCQKVIVAFLSDGQKTGAM